MNHTPDIPKVDFEERAFKSEKETANAKYAKGWKLELLALSGFCLSGVIFIISGVQSGDFLTVSGSVVWIASCICWMIPYKRFF